MKLNWGDSWDAIVGKLFTDTEKMPLRGFEELKLHILLLGMLAETKRGDMLEWHWDQWLLNYHIALQSDGNVGISGPRAGLTLS